MQQAFLISFGTRLTDNIDEYGCNLNHDLIIN